MNTEEAVKQNDLQVVKKQNEVLLNPQHLAMDFKKLLPRQSEVGDMNYQTAQKAYDKIIMLWNKDEVSRNFVKHLIIAFYPYKPIDRVLFVDEKSEPITCSVLGYKLTGIDNINQNPSLSNFIEEKTILNAGIASEGRKKPNDQEIAKMKTLKDMLPVEIKFQQIAVISNKSKKCLQAESAFALDVFTKAMAEGMKNEEVLKIVDFKSNKKQNKPSKPVDIRRTIEGNLKGGSFEALKNFKPENK